MPHKKNITIGITMGDPSGIGPEVIVKALADKKVCAIANFIVIGDSDVFRRYGFGHRLQNNQFIDIQCSSKTPFPLGNASPQGAQASLDCLRKAFELLKVKAINALVTGPVCKEAICSLGYKFQGHTEYIASHFNIKRFAMMFVTKNLKTVLVTRHMPLRKVSAAITAAAVYAAIDLTAHALQKNFRIHKPRIAVCGLNPHAGEGGVLGKEEIEKINPAIRKANKNRIAVFGPFAADTLFYSNNRNNYDAIVAMYHDQGLIPIKTLYFDELVNLTIGLPFIRTSPAHGTAFDIAGKNKADPSSMRSAIQLAAELTK